LLRAGQLVPVSEHWPSPYWVLDRRMAAGEPVRDALNGRAFVARQEHDAPLARIPDEPTADLDPSLQDCSPQWCGNESQDPP
jgi:hypothetical protein